MATLYAVPVTFTPAIVGGKVVNLENVGGMLSLEHIPNALITEEKLSAAVTTKLNASGGGVTSFAGLTGTIALAQISDGSITEAKLSTAVQTKLNTGGGTTDLTPVNNRLLKLESKTSAIELRQLDPIALPSNEDVKFAVALPDENGVVKDPALSEYVKTKSFSAITRGRLYGEVPSNLNFTDYLLENDDDSSDKIYFSDLHREVQAGTEPTETTINFTAGVFGTSGGIPRFLASSSDSPFVPSQGTLAINPLIYGINFLSGGSSTSDNLSIYVRKNMRLQGNVVLLGQTIPVSSLNLDTRQSTYDIYSLPRGSSTRFFYSGQATSIQVTPTVGQPQINSQFEIDGFSVGAGSSYTLKKKNPNQEHVHHMTLGVEPITQVRGIAQEEIAKIPAPEPSSTEITAEERFKVSKLNTYNQVNRIQIEDAHFSETSGADAITKDIATTFTATKTGTLFIAIPSGEANEHPDLTIGVVGSSDARVLAKKEVFSSSPQFFLYSHPATTGVQYDVRYDVNVPDLTLNRDVADLQREQGQLSQLVNNNASQIVDIRKKTDLMTVSEDDSVSYSVPDWFEGTFLKGGDATTTARATLENLSAKSHQTMMWTSIDPTNELNQRPHALLRYDTNDVNPSLSAVRNFLGYRLNSSNNKMEVYKSFLVPSGERTETVRVADHTGKGAGSPRIVNLGISPQVGRDVTISYDRNLPQANETINARVTAFLNDINEGEQSFDVPSSATRGSPATHTYNAVINGVTVPVATMTVFYEDGIIDFEIDNINQTNEAVNGGHLSIDFDYPRVSNVPAHLSEEVLWSSSDLTSRINIAMLKYNDSDNLKGRWGLNINGATSVLEFSKASTTENPELLATNPEVSGGIANVYVRELTTAVAQADIDSRLDTVRQGANDSYAGLRETTESHHTILKIASQVEVLNSEGRPVLLGSETPSTPITEVENRYLTIQATLYPRDVPLLNNVPNINWNPNPTDTTLTTSDYEQGMIPDGEGGFTPLLSVDRPRSLVVSKSTGTGRQARFTLFNADLRNPVVNNRKLWTNALSTDRIKAGSRFVTSLSGAITLSGQTSGTPRNIVMTWFVYHYNIPSVNTPTFITAKTEILPIKNTDSGGFIVEIPLASFNSSPVLLKSIPIATRIRIDVEVVILHTVAEILAYKRAIETNKLVPASVTPEQSLQLTWDFNSTNIEFQGEKA